MPANSDDVARSEATDPTGHVYELQVLDGTTLRDPEPAVARDPLARLAGRLVDAVARRTARASRGEPTCTIRIVKISNGQRDLQGTVVTDLANRDEQIARIRAAIVDGTFDADRLGR